MLLFLLIFLILLFVFLIISYVVYRLAFHSPDKKQNDPMYILNGKDTPELRKLLHPLIQNLVDMPYEKVVIKSRDGLNLVGRFYAGKEGAPVDICVHGWRGLSIRDFCYASRLFFDMGHNVLIIEQRSHGLSEGKTLTFGIKEKDDGVEWVNYVIQRFGPQVKINLIGVSMGAATVLMMANQNLPEQVIHIAADCPYSSPIEIINKVCKSDFHISPVLAHPFIVAGAFLFGNFNIADKKYSAVEAVKGCNIPILIIHGEADTFVPCQMSAEIAAANPSIQRETFTGADHGLSLVVDPERYTAIVNEFLH